MARKKEPDQLSKDSTAALRANMSYGKWKAYQWEKAGRPAFSKEKVPEGNTICRYCGNSFVSTSKHKRSFCTDDCKYAHARMMRREMCGKG